MDIFRKFDVDTLKIFQTRVELKNVSLQDAQTAGRQIAWDQLHILKLENGNVDVSLITGVDPSAELWKFLQGDEPEPIQG